jgi:death on curing protein
MITISKTLELHNRLIDDFGGSKGVRDIGLLEAAITRPFQTFGGEDLYNSPIEKAAAIIESVVKNHPFIDGNKRTGYALMNIILWHHGLSIQESVEKEYNFVIAIAEGRYDFEDIKTWIESHV